MSDWQQWLVQIPEYDYSGVQIQRFEVTKQQAFFDQLRAAANPQRSDRSVREGTFTRLMVDGILWMTDTPAEIQDLREIDHIMARYSGGSMLIAGLGLGLVLHRAITVHGMGRIDVVEQEWRVIDAVAPYYDKLAADHGVVLNIHRADIHEWRAPRGRTWDVGFFDIWPTIDSDDMPEVKRLRDRFRSRLGVFSAWAQDERVASNRRVRTGRGWY